MNLHRTTSDPASPRSFWRVVVLGVLAVASGAAQSSTDTNAGGNASVETLRKRIDELEAGQKQMQQTIDTLKGAAPAAGATPAAPAAVVDTGTPDASGPDSFDHAHALGPVQFQGFSDFDYGRNWFENLPPTGLGGSPQSFSVGDFDLLTNTRIAEHWSMLGEVLVTSDFTNEFSVEIDRLMLTYRKNEYFKISAGKFNTALGYYTNAFHRAQYFQTVVGKPIMYSDEDSNGILPVHNIGITATGLIPSGRLGLHWVAEVANGRSITPDGEAVQNFVDQNNGKAVNFAAYIRPDWLSGFQTGFSFYRDTQHPFGIAAAVGETIFTAHVAYVGRRLEWLNEGALLRHALQGGNDHISRSTTSYTQVSWAVGKFRPYARYDYENVPKSDPIFGLVGELDGQPGRIGGPSFGVNRHISDYVVLKLQYGRLSQRGVPTANGYTAQVAFAF